jgi:hypothetical protein
LTSARQTYIIGASGEKFIAPGHTPWRIIVRTNPRKEEHPVVKTFFCMLVVLTAVSCASFREGYETRFGLANPDNPPIHPDPVDETYSAGTIGQQHIEEYDRKYHDKAIFDREKTEVLEEETTPGEQ